MDLRSYFSAAGSSKVAPLASSSCEDESETSEVEESNPPKKLCIDSTALSKPSRGKSRTQSGKRKYNKKWEEEFTWLEFDEDHQVVRYVGKEENHSREVGVLGLQNHFPTGEKQ